MNLLKILFSTSLLICSISCDNDNSDDEKQSETVTPITAVNDITYEKDVKNIIVENCLECHTNPPQKGAPIALVTFAEVKAKSGAISDRMKDINNPMPKSGLLDASVVKVIDDWIAGGLKEK